MGFKKLMETDYMKNNVTYWMYILVVAFGAGIVITMDHYNQAMKTPVVIITIIIFGVSLVQGLKAKFKNQKVDKDMFDRNISQDERIDLKSESKQVLSFFDYIDLMPKRYVFSYLSFLSVFSWNLFALYYLGVNLFWLFLPLEILMLLSPYINHMNPSVFKTILKVFHIALFPVYHLVKVITKDSLLTFLLVYNIGKSFDSDPIFLLFFLFLIYLQEYGRVLQYKKYDRLVLSPTKK